MAEISECTRVAVDALGPFGKKEAEIRQQHAYIVSVSVTVTALIGKLGRSNVGNMK
jgi:hypothetical protein